METKEIAEEVGGLESGAAGKALREWMRGMARNAMVDVLAQEVVSLCGPSHERTEGHARECYRAGHAPGGMVSLSS